MDRDYDVVLVDLHNIVYRTLFVLGEQENLFDLWKKAMFTTLMHNAVSMWNSNNVILCSDGPNNWRKSYYKEYKAHRKGLRDQSYIDFDEFFKVMNDFQDSLVEYLPFTFLKVDGAEADDIIGVFVRGHPSAKKLIVSTDKDYKHLQIVPNTHQYDPVKKQMVVCDDPKQFLLEMILKGDKGDNVPPVRKGIGDKTAAKIASQGVDQVHFFIEREGLTKEFNRNLKLISLFHIPKEIADSIRKMYICYNRSQLQLESFLKDNNLYHYLNDKELLFRTEKALLDLY